MYVKHISGAFTLLLTLHTLADRRFLPATTEHNVNVFWYFFNQTVRGDAVQKQAINATGVGKYSANQL
jgi:hypothetical protein